MKLLLPLILLLAAAPVLAQEAKQCRDLPDYDFELNRRVTVPARVEAYDGLEITVKRTFATLVKYEKFPVDAETFLPVGFEADYKNHLYTIVFCADNRTVISVQRFSAMKNGYESKKEQDKRLARVRKEKKQ